MNVSDPQAGTGHRRAVPEADEAWLTRTLVALGELSTPVLDLAECAQQVATRCADRFSGHAVAVVLRAVDTAPVCSGSDDDCLGLERHGLRTDEGPAATTRLRCGRQPRSVLLDGSGPWPGFADEARRRGYGAVHSYPITTRDGDEALGVVDFFAPHDVTPPPVEVITALARCLGLRLELDTALRDAIQESAELRTALDSRALIEQAKGMLAQCRGISPDSAFRALRSHARGRNRLLLSVCESVVHREIALDTIDVDLRTMSPARRLSLREDALARWQQTLARSHEQHLRAVMARSRSSELILQLQLQSALREINTIDRSIKQRARQLASRPRRGSKPRVLVGCGDGAMQAFAVGTIRLDGRLDLVGQAPRSSDLLGVSIVEQPDVVILGPSLLSRPGRFVAAELQRFCPGSRTLLLLERPTDLAAAGKIDVDVVLAGGEPAALVPRVVELCGARGRRRA